MGWLSECCIEVDVGGCTVDNVTVSEPPCGDETSLSGDVSRDFRIAGSSSLVMWSLLLLFESRKTCKINNINTQ